MTRKHEKPHDWDMDAELKDYLVQMEARLTTRIDGFAVAFTGNLTDLRKELTGRMDLSDMRMESIERTMMHMNLTLGQLDLKVTSLNRLIGGVQSDHQALLGNQAGLQRTLDDLTARVKKLEERNAA